MKYLFTFKIHFYNQFFSNFSKDVKPLSCTQIACGWNKKYKEALEDYKPLPLEEHPCFSDAPPSDTEDLRHLTKIVDQQKSSKNARLNSETSNFKNIHAKSKTIKRVKRADELSKETKDHIKKILFSIETSAIVIAAKGRHGPVKMKEKTKVTDDDRKIYSLIFEKQDSVLSEMISAYTVNPVQDCCNNILLSLNVNGVSVCESTRNWFAEWMAERKYRITGSICYELYTYVFNLNPDWKSKCDRFIEPKAFKTEATEYGNKYEHQAREVFKADYPNFKVIETGLVVSQVNPWMAYTPDGVMVKNGVIDSVLEIKCPLQGRSNTIEVVVENLVKSKQNCLIKEGENIFINKRHKYYGQVQMGMFILNVKVCYFVIHASCDKKNFTLRVFLDENFLSEMLQKLKTMYYQVLLPEICHRTNPTDSPHKDGSHLNFKLEKEKKVKKLNKIKNAKKVKRLNKIKEVCSPDVKRV